MRFFIPNHNSPLGEYHFCDSKNITWLKAKYHFAVRQNLTRPTGRKFNYCFLHKKMIQYDKGLANLPYTIKEKGIFYERHSKKIFNR